jgi:Protein of unknown function (DUF3108)
MGMFHNAGMVIFSNILSVNRTPAVWIGVVCGVLSIAAHGLFLAWAKGSIELPTWTAPLRDTPVQVAIVVVPEPAPKQASLSTPSPRLNKETKASKVTTPKPPRSPVSKPSTGAVAADAPALSETAPVEVTSKEPGNDASVSPLSDSPSTVEPSRPAEVQKQADLYPGGLGTLKESAAYPYKFYLGEYTDNNVLGSAYFVVESTPTEYKLAIVGKASGLTSLLFSGATYRSEGVFSNDGFAPTKYAEKSGKRAERQSTVDYVAREVTLGEQKKPVLQGLQDRVSVIWQVGLVLRARPDVAQLGKSLPIPLMSTRSLENAQFVSQGIVTLDKNGQSIQAVHFRFMPTNNQNKAQIDLWYELDKLPQPLRVRWVDDRQRTVDIFRDD